MLTMASLQSMKSIIRINIVDDNARAQSVSATRLLEEPSQSLLCHLANNFQASSSI